MNNVNFRIQFARVRQVFTILVFLVGLLGFNTATVQADTAAVQDLPIVAGNDWRYFKGTVEPPATWKAINFDDSTWLLGPGGFGYGDGDDGTVLNDMASTYVSVYIRKAFNVTDPTIITGLQFSIDYDDGFVAYLNGTEIARKYLNGTPPTYASRATIDHEASHGDNNPQPVEYFSVSPSLLQAGTNVLAVEGHNTDVVSSDLSLIPGLAITSQLYTLTVSSAGHGTVTINPPSGTGKYQTNTVVTLTPVPDAGYSFSNWTGANAADVTDNGNGSWSITINGPKAVTANFTSAEYTLTVTSAHGTVTKDPDKAKYNYGDIVQLTASPAADWTFAGWTGGATGTTNPVSVTMNGNTAVTANYVPTEYALAITSAHGTVTKNPDKATYHAGEVVQLTMVPAAGWSFVNWTGDATGADNPVSITISGNTAVTANYTQVGYTLTLESAHGTVTKSPEQALYHYGDVVQLTAKPMSGWMFDSWSGDLTGTANPISVTMIGNQSVKANYVRSGADTTGVFRPSNGALYLKNKNETGYADVQINYGIGGDYPIVGDWDGDGDATIGIFRNGTFYLRNSNTIGYADVMFVFGVRGDQPVAGDWDGDGIDTIGVYRNGLFLLRNSNSAGPADATFALGMARDVGIAGDWDGDGKDTTGVFRPSNGALYLKNKNETGYADLQINYGIGGDKPVVGDWNNDGIDTIGVYRNGTFLLRNSNTIGYAEIVFALGIPGDMPIAGNWDGLPNP